MHSKVLAISPFGSSPSAGHVLIDDSFYIKKLSSLPCDFVFCSPAYSIYCNSKCSSTAVTKFLTLDLIHLLVVIKSILWADKIVLLGFTEPILLLALLVIVFRRSLSSPCLYIVATNNFSSVRIKKYYIPLKIMFFVFNPFFAKIIVHSRLEKRRLLFLCPSLLGRITIKRHHLMSSDW